MLELSLEEQPPFQISAKNISNLLFEYLICSYSLCIMIFCFFLADSHEDHTQHHVISVEFQNFPVKLWLCG